MKSIEAIYKFGNLYNKETKKRILIEDGSEISVSINPDNVLDQDPNLRPDNLLDAAEKEEEIKEFIGKHNYWKLLDTGTLLFFYITAGVKRKDSTDSVRCIFQVRLLEDLYIYNKKTEPEDCRFFDCHCLVEKCLSDFEFFEPLYAKSLNDAYTKTYELYFAMFGKSTCNAFNRYFENSAFRKPAIRKKTEDIQKAK